LGDNSLLTFLDDEKAGSKPNQHSHASQQTQANPSALHIWLEATAATHTARAPCAATTARFSAAK
jgi:hypothetical protein